MLIAKDRNLRIREFEGGREFSWTPSRVDRIASAFAAGFFALLGITLCFEAITVGLKILGVIIAAIPIILWISYMASIVTVTAYPDRLTVRRKYFGRGRPRVLRAPILQFYLRGATSASTVGTALYALDHEHHEWVVVPGTPSAAMTLQLWTELQDTYGLEDLEVLGELGHKEVRAKAAHRKRKEGE